MIHIVCFQWGDWFNRGEEYVNKLYRGVCKHTNYPFIFSCITNKPNLSLDKHINIIQIRNVEQEYKYLKNGNLRKLLIHYPGFKFKGRIVLMDIDMIITGDLNDIVKYNGKFCTCESPRRTGKIGGSLVSFDASISPKFWEAIKDKDRLRNYALRGSERQFYRHMKMEKIIFPDFWSKICPGQTLSYKWHCRINNNTLPVNARVVWFHGNPKTHKAAKDIKWIEDNWK